ncbi:MAG: 5-oxoprolinase subunit PxpA [Bacteroidota bacterium]
MKQIDINCDMGESFGNFRVGNDEAIFPYITSANIACGFHGGDPVHMEKTIRNALKYRVKIGAHPGYPDLAGFGRRMMELKSEELTAIIKYQVSAIKGMAESLGGKLSYVKPHGALYNKASNSEQETRAIIKGILAIDPELIFMGLAGSIMEEIAKSEGVSFVAEAFADRRYEPTGRLMSRAKEGSVLGDAEVASDQVLSIAKDHQLTAAEGEILEVHAQSICIHGDNPAAVDILKAIDRKLSTHGIVKQSFS